MRQVTRPVARQARRVVRHPAGRYGIAPVRLGDQVAELAARALWADTAEVPLLVRRLADPPPGRRWAALATPALDGVVLVSLAEQGDAPPAGHVDLLAVDPAARGRGIGRALVRAAEDWLRGYGAAEIRLAGNPPCYAWPGIDVRYTPAACLAESLGYERYHVAWNMTVDLTDSAVTNCAGAAATPAADLDRLARAGITVHAAAGPDRATVIAYVRENWGEAWAWEVEQAAGCHYAVRDGRVIGFAAWGARPLWFGPMGTASEARGLGVGRTLLRRCLAEQAAAGLRSAQIGWVGPIRFYSRAVGARVERVFWLYRRTLG